MNDDIRQLNDMGQGLWVHGVGRASMASGLHHRFIREFSITSLSNQPTILEQAFAADGRDEASKTLDAVSGADEELFVEWTLAGPNPSVVLRHAVSCGDTGAGGWTSVEVEPLRVQHSVHPVVAGARRFQSISKADLFIKIPGTREGVRAVEEVIFDGVPVNVAMLFSREHYLAAAIAYMRGIERRLIAHLDPKVPSVASMFICRCDAAVPGEAWPPGQHRVGIAMALLAYRAHLDVLGSERWQHLAAAGAVPQRLLWARARSVGASGVDALHVHALVAPARRDTHVAKASPMFAEQLALAERLQRDAVAGFSTSWCAFHPIEDAALG